MTTQTDKERLDIKAEYPIHADDVQKRSLNDVVKEKPDSTKVIVREDGSIQAVGIDETNVEDNHPNLNPQAEITPTIRVQAAKEPTSEEVLNDGTPKVSLSEVLEDAKTTAVHEEVKKNIVDEPQSKTITETKVVKEPKK